MNDDNEKIYTALKYKNKVYTPKLTSEGLDIPMYITLQGCNYVYYLRIYKDTIVQMINQYFPDIIIKEKFGCYDCHGTHYEEGKGMIIPMIVNDQISYSLIPDEVIKQAINSNIKKKKSLFERIKDKLKKIISY